VRYENSLTILYLVRNEIKKEKMMNITGAGEDMDVMAFARFWRWYFGVGFRRTSDVCHLVIAVYFLSSYSEWFSVSQKLIKWTV
jgi:hypothetical protein